MKRARFEPLTAKKLSSSHADKSGAGSPSLGGLEPGVGAELRRLVDEPVREKGRPGLLAAHPDEPGALLVQALVLLLAAHADKSGSGWSRSEEVLSEVVVEVNVDVVTAEAVVDVVLLASHPDEAGSSFEAVDVVAVLLWVKKFVTN